ncbi:molybdopterin-guanine dinucleotide biosynthesis protein B [Tropicimonas sp. TH_r6]|uniref:molybdopterin-guanine dinucleotide biosynthesis protein B n=1 Tax=Tropicimonas sp. TH_r6 TaxID=3082085 RepID=UPI0029544D33|nr:molybdopterin-guanine dinucleotide biosynthesis protein B [Tropicimonas sp. TH_r6]MDV7141234.1 molybdopterin-guanine dinucleotide biosynthesis protein B [Tropicimonas sp. TH_r6]
MKIFGVTGWKNSGKTGLMERLVANITARGLRVSTVKHAHHGFDIDQPGRDSFRHREAGAEQVLLVSSSRWALMTELREVPEPTLEEMLDQITPVDLVLVEGFKRDRHPKIEAQRIETGQPLIAPEDETIRAIATNRPDIASDALSGRPAFDLDATDAIAEFILKEVGLA